MPGNSIETPHTNSPSISDLERTLTNNLLRDSVDAIYFKDLESRFVRVSKYLAQRLGFDAPEDLIGKTDFDVFDYEHAQDARNDELEIIASGEAKEAKLEREVLPDNEVRWVLTSKMPLKNEQGVIVGTFGISRDISAQKEAEFALEDSNKRLIEASRRAGMAEIAINVLHNIGNVLNSVNISSATSMKLANSIKPEQLSKVAEILEDNAATPEFLKSDARGKQIAPYLRGLSEQISKSQSRIVEELQSLSIHVDHIKGILKTQQSYAKSQNLLEDFSLAEVLEDAIQINNDALLRHGIKFDKQIGEDHRMRNDKHRILQIIVNFIRNAKFACDEDPKPEKRISLSTETTGENELKISVSDNGVGIPKENLKAIFQHGFTTRAEGNGFGLHSCANLASEIGGQVTVSSEGHGKGAVFSLILPIKREASTQDSSET